MRLVRLPVLAPGSVDLDSPPECVRAPSRPRRETLRGDLERPPSGAAILDTSADRRPDRRPPSTTRLSFASAHGRTILREASAGGPWRVLRAAEGTVCEAILVQARGGLIDGDRWRLDVELAPGARVRLRTIGATLLHRGRAILRVRLRLAAGARLAWCPAGIIPFPGGGGRVTTVIDLGPSAVAAGGEAIVVGEAAPLAVRLVVRRRGRPWHLEVTRLDRQPSWPSRLGPATHVGSAWRVGPGAEAAVRRWEAVLMTGSPSAAVDVARAGVVSGRLLATSLQEIVERLTPCVDQEVMA